MHMDAVHPSGMPSRAANVVLVLLCASTGTSAGRTRRACLCRPRLWPPPSYRLAAPSAAPQVEAQACGSRRSCVRSYPTAEGMGVLFVWGDAGPGAAEESAAAPLPINPRLLALKPGAQVGYVWMARGGAGSEGARRQGVGALRVRVGSRGSAAWQSIEHASGRPVRTGGAEVWPARRLAASCAAPAAARLRLCTWAGCTHALMQPVTPSLEPVCPSAITCP
jgi:hypothetical protein